MYEGAPCRLAFDIGGTFTDIVLVDGYGALTVEKLLTTPHAPEEAAKRGTASALARIGAAVGDVELGVHGTTLVTNAMIERRRRAHRADHDRRASATCSRSGAEMRYDIYDLFIPLPEPLVTRRLRLERAPSRIGADGRVLAPLDEVAVVRALDALGGRGRRGCRDLLPPLATRTRRTSGAAAELAREHVPDLAVSLSSRGRPEIGEYERFSTTVANAYVQPLTRRATSTTLGQLAARRGSAAADDAVERRHVSVERARPLARSG